MTYRTILHALLYWSGLAHTLAQDQSAMDCAIPEELPAISLLQTGTHFFHSVQTQTRSSVKLPHDENVNECDSSMPIPPVAGIWSGRFEEPQKANVIVDIGGNVGDDVSFFVTKHPKARIFTFEPIPKLFKQLQARFSNSTNVIAQNFGVSDADAQREFVLEGPSGIGTTGTDHNVHGDHVQVQLRDVNQVLSWVQKETGQVPDLLSMNCEGCEYSVMQRMAESGWLAKLPNIQLSWHVAGDVPDRVSKRCSIEKLLWQSHKRIFQSSFGWVGWQRL